MTGIKGTQDQLFTMVEDDFSGTDSFLYWLVAMFLIGSLGYVPSLKGISNALLILILLVLLLHQDPTKLFGNLTSSLQASSATPASPVTTQAAQNITTPLEQTVANINSKLNSLSAAVA